MLAKPKVEAREYQRPLVDKILEHLAAGVREVVMAGAPNIGKTNMAIVIARRWLDVNPGQRVLVLPHGTTVLRDNFVGPLETKDAGFRHAVYVARDNDKHVAYGDLDADVVVGLPATLAAAHARGEKLGKFGLVIVDEAHEHYHAERVKALLTLVGKPQVLALTGTPGRFIAEWKTAKLPREQWPIVSVSIAEAMDYTDDNGNPIYTDPVFMLATSTYKIRVRKDEDGESDLNSKGDLSLSGEKKLDNEPATRASLEDFLTALRRKFEPKAARLLARDFCDVRHLLKKTMIACGSIKQANHAYKIFCKAGYVGGIEVLLSHSKNDPDSLMMQEFKKQDAAKILVVVDRGSLGYDCPELANAVDMTGSLNPSSIFQFACRLVRWSPNIEKKYFLKIAPEGQADYTMVIMSIVMQLGAHKEFYETFDGRLSSNLPVLMRTKRPKLEIVRGKKIKAKDKNATQQRIVDEELLLFTDWEKLTHNHGDVIALYARTTLGKVRETLLGVQIKNPEERKKLIFEAVSRGEL